MKFFTLKKQMFGIENFTNYNVIINGYWNERVQGFSKIGETKRIDKVRRMNTERR